MTEKFLACLARTLREESGEVQPESGPPFKRGRWSFSDDKNDPGGKTMMGITQDEYNAWRDLNGHPFRDVREIDDEELVAIYRVNYWDPTRAEHLPPGVDLAVFDFAVNSGFSTAIKKLQAALGIAVDGHLGVKTQLAVAQADAFVVVGEFMDMRRAYGRGLKNYPSFKGGWETRWERIEAAAFDMTGTESAAPAAVDEVPRQPVSRKAYDPPPTSMLQSDTGNMAALAGGSSLAGVGVSVGKTVSALLAAGKTVTLAVVAATVTSREEFWIALTGLVCSLFIWLERRRKMIMEHA